MKVSDNDHISEVSKINSLKINCEELPTVKPIFINYAQRNIRDERNPEVLYYKLEIMQLTLDSVKYFIYSQYINRYQTLSKIWKIRQQNILSQGAGTSHKDNKQLLLHFRLIGSVHGPVHRGEMEQQFPAHYDAYNPERSSINIYTYLKFIVDFSNCPVSVFLSVRFLQFLVVTPFQLISLAFNFCFLNIYAQFYEIDYNFQKKKYLNRTDFRSSSFISCSTS